MRITKEQQYIVDSLRCERLTSDLGNRELVKGFENRTNPNLADYLKNEAWDEDLRGDVTYYLVKSVAGCKYVFLFAADASEEGSLMTYYRDSLHFEEPENLGTNKPFYDLFCKFMCQETGQLLAGQEEFYETFNPDLEDV